MKTVHYLKAIWISLIASTGVSMASASESAHVVVEIDYTIDGGSFKGAVVRPAELMEPRVGIVMIPNWMGMSAASIEKAKKVADNGYLVFVADMYGVDVRPANAQEAGAAAGAVRADRAIMRQRVAAAQEQLIAFSGGRLTPERIAAIGFCFGGGAVLEYARSGAAIAGVVSFHGDLLSPTLETDAAMTRAAVLVLHGAIDPFVPPAHVDEWLAAMKPTDVDWQFVHFSKAVHSFTDPTANMPGRAEYHAPSARRAFEMMDDFFDELFED